MDLKMDNGEKEFKAYKADKLRNQPTFKVALDVCKLLSENCVTNQQAERVLLMVQQILEIPKAFTPERYL